MDEASRIDQFLADLKRRFTRCDLTYAEAVMIEDLIAAITQLHSLPTDHRETDRPDFLVTPEEDPDT